MLEGLDHVVLSALRHKPHPSHATVEQAVEWARRIGAKQTWLTHIAHELGHEETNAKLPESMQHGLRRTEFSHRAGRCEAHEQWHDSDPGSVFASSARSKKCRGTSARPLPPLEISTAFISVTSKFSAAADEAQARGMRSIAITFDPHPAQFLCPEEAPKLLTFLPERLRLLATTGVDAVLVLRFDEALSRVTAETLCATSSSVCCKSAECTKAAISALAMARRRE